MPDQSREPTLPDGIKELAKVIELQQQADTDLKEAALDIAVQGQRLAPVIFARLQRTIDEDLLFSDQAELVMPDIKVMTAKVLRELTGEAPSSRLDSWMVEIVSREVHKFIQQHRPKPR